MLRWNSGTISSYCCLFRRYRNQIGMSGNPELYRPRWYNIVGTVFLKICYSDWFLFCFSLTFASLYLYCFHQWKFHGWQGFTECIYKSSPQRTLKRENVAKQLFPFVRYFCPIYLAEVYLRTLNSLVCVKLCSGSDGSVTPDSPSCKLKEIKYIFYIISPSFFVAFAFTTLRNKERRWKRALLMGDPVSLTPARKLTCYDLQRKQSKFRDTVPFKEDSTYHTLRANTFLHLS